MQTYEVPNLGFTDLEAAQPIVVKLADGQAPGAPAPIDPNKLNRSTGRGADTYTVAELKDFARQFGVHTSGTKTQLVERLQEALQGGGVQTPVQALPKQQLPIPAAAPLINLPARATVNDGYEEIRVDQNPTQIKWRLTPLYKADVGGNMREWQVGFDGEQYLEMTHGVVGGAIVPTRSEVEPKAGRNLQQQALQEARQRYLEKFRNENYRPAGAPPPDDISPMLAFTFVTHDEYNKKQAEFTEALRKAGNPKGKERNDIKRTFFNDKWKLVERYPVFVQAKLDGHRMMCKLVGDRVVCRKPRSNRLYPNTIHQEQDLLPFFAYLPTGTVLDGELYHQDWNFEKLTSVVKTEKRIHPLMNQVIYYIFDIITPEPMPYEDRYTILVNAYQRYLEDGNIPRNFTLVSVTVANSDDEVKSFHDQYVALGYEGLILRKIAGPNRTPVTINESIYEPKRTANLLKYKAFDDEEGIAIGVQEAKGTEAGAADVIIRDPRGNTLTVRTRGSVERRRMWMQNPNLILNKPFTYRFQGLSETGVPRFPVGIGPRND